MFQVVVIEIQGDTFEQEAQTITTNPEFVILMSYSLQRCTESSSYLIKLLPVLD